jgi:hypothetical protein
MIGMDDAAGHGRAEPNLGDEARPKRRAPTGIRCNSHDPVTVLHRARPIVNVVPTSPDRRPTQ